VSCELDDKNQEEKVGEEQKMEENKKAKKFLVVL
jgi:hypothetical protein